MPGRSDGGHGWRPAAPVPGCGCLACLRDHPDPPPPGQRVALVHTAPAVIRLGRARLATLWVLDNLWFTCTLALVGLAVGTLIGLTLPPLVVDLVVLGAAGTIVGAIRNLTKPTIAEARSRKVLQEINRRKP